MDTGETDERDSALASRILRVQLSSDMRESWSSQCSEAKLDVSPM